MNKMVIMFNLFLWVFLIGFIVLVTLDNRHREYMNKITQRDPEKTCLHINQFKDHQDIYIVPVEKWEEHPSDWWSKNYPKEFYVGYYSFSLFYWGQRSPQ